MPALSIVLFCLKFEFFDTFTVHFSQCSYSVQLPCFWLSSVRLLALEFWRAHERKVHVAVLAISVIWIWMRAVLCCPLRNPFLLLLQLMCPVIIAYSHKGVNRWLLVFFLFFFSSRVKLYKVGWHALANNTGCARIWCSCLIHWSSTTFHVLGLFFAALNLFFYGVTVFSNYLHRFLLTQSTLRLLISQSTDF